jgi:hypothetical protein
MNPEYAVFKDVNGVTNMANFGNNMGYNNNAYHSQSTSMAKLSKEYYYMTWPTVAGNAHGHSL